MPRATILFVDDSSFLRKHLCSVLADTGYEVHSVDDGAQALDWVTHNAPADLVITDLHMPNLGGVGLVAMLRAHRHYRTVPIFIMTSGADPEEKDSARAAGATAWIVKPFDKAKLVTAIERAIMH